MRMDRNKNKPELVFSSLPDILTVKDLQMDLQMALRIGKSTAYKLIQGGEIQHFCIGKSIRIYKQSVVAYLNRALYNNGNVSNSSVPTKEDNV